MQVDKELSRRAALEVGAEAQQCYANAWRALRDLPELAGALYVDGYAVDRMHDVHASLGVIEHGWIELDGRIVDPTLHDDREPLAYYPGLRFTLGELHTAMHTIPKTTNEDLPIFYRLGWGGQDSPDMMQAAALAYDAAGLGTLAEQYRDAARAALGELQENGGGGL